MKIQCVFLFFNDFNVKFAFDHKINVVMREIIFKRIKGIIFILT